MITTQQSYCIFGRFQKFDTILKTRNNLETFTIDGNQITRLRSIYNMNDICFHRNIPQKYKLKLCLNLTESSFARIQRRFGHFSVTQPSSIITYPSCTCTMQQKTRGPFCFSVSPHPDFINLIISNVIVTLPVMMIPH